jgi:hypothetical protein
VLLRSPKCEAASFDADAFVQHLTIELIAAELRLVRDDAAAPSAEMIVEISARVCDPGAMGLTVAIAANRTGARREHAIALHDVEPRARPRALALAIAELIRQDRIEPGVHGRPPSENVDDGVGQSKVEPPSPTRWSEPAVPTGRAREPAAEERAPRGPDLLLAAQGRFFAAEPTLFFGANLAGSFSLGTAWLRGRADVGGSWSAVEDSLGRVSMGLYSGGVALLAAAGQSPELVIGPHVELGYAYANGTPIDLRSRASDGGRVVALASLIAGTRLRFHRWAAAFEVDLGTSLRGVQMFADDRRIAMMEGFFVGARAGIAYEY